jgi:hypothetical protein
MARQIRCGLWCGGPAKGREGPQHFQYPTTCCTAANLDILNARTIRDIDAIFATLAQMRADALLVATDAFFFTRATQLVVLSARHAIPTLYSRRQQLIGAPNCRGNDL